MDMRDGRGGDLPTFQDSVEPSYGGTVDEAVGVECAAAVVAGVSAGSGGD